MILCMVDSLSKIRQWLLYRPRTGALLGRITVVDCWIVTQSITEQWMNAQEKDDEKYLNANGRALGQVLCNPWCLQMRSGTSKSSELGMKRSMGGSKNGESSKIAADIMRVAMHLSSTPWQLSHRLRQLMGPGLCFQLAICNCVLRLGIN